ncbi:hypothetical protein VOLCADRAFT_92030 [Volvox carteri f. nagariensis]|uniref:SAP domain-containing protein n=1 Tax=Volvox carteri f. nagariensis TaxID=3068 RepID=D8TYX4_VOLCA|nr:uncharacterized protein VOLCADRAFT_92030 [Volvox carteri f. nagariensis]EFJ47390.1 hypothetical protein VOLCADRAFT_92030 [Volvox carteri f. nagariensis]|eukprot:XP_002951579.1 hypothetical protein VOLCADRAFT_92030 [Volvox carteri f. nagariensis]
MADASVKRTAERMGNVLKHGARGGIHVTKAPAGSSHASKDVQQGGIQELWKLIFVQLAGSLEPTNGVRGPGVVTADILRAGMTCRAMLQAASAGLWALSATVPIVSRNDVPLLLPALVMPPSSGAAGPARIDRSVHGLREVGGEPEWALLDEVLTQRPVLCTEAQLRSALQQLNQPVEGSRGELVARVEELLGLPTVAAAEVTAGQRREAVTAAAGQRREAVTAAAAATAGQRREAVTAAAAMTAGQRREAVTVAAAVTAGQRREAVTVAAAVTAGQRREAVTVAAAVTVGQRREAVTVAAAAAAATAPLALSRPPLPARLRVAVLQERLAQCGSAVAPPLNVRLAAALRDMLEAGNGLVGAALGQPCLAAMRRDLCALYGSTEGILAAHRACLPGLIQLRARRGAEVLGRALEAKEAAEEDKTLKGAVNDHCKQKGVRCEVPVKSTLEERVAALQRCGFATCVCGKLAARMCSMLLCNECCRAYDSRQLSSAATAGAKSNAALAPESPEPRTGRQKGGLAWKRDPEQYGHVRGEPWDIRSQEVYAGRVVRRRCTAERSQLTSWDEAGGGGADGGDCTHAGKKDDDDDIVISGGGGGDAIATGGSGGGQRGRRLTQSSAAQQGSSVDNASITFNPRLACEGCPAGDPRVMVRQPNTPPFAAVGLLAQEQRRFLSGSVSQCTATLIGPSHLLTAAHCVVAPDRWTFIEQVRWFPRLDTGTTAEVRSLPVRTIRVLERAREGHRGAGPADGWVPRTLGLYRFIMYRPLLLLSSHFLSDKPRGTMWTVRCPRVRFDFEGTELAGCGGMCSNMDGTTYNVGTELNDFVYGTLATWYNEDVQSPRAQLEVPPSYTNGYAAATATTENGGGDRGAGGSTGSGLRSWIDDHVFVPVLVGGRSVLVLSRDEPPTV